MFISQIWYTKEEGQYLEDEETIMRENNCLDPDYVENSVSIESSELHNWNKPKIEEVKDEYFNGTKVADGWKHFKSYELDMLINEQPNNASFVVYKDGEVVDEGSFNKKDLDYFSLEKWIRWTFIENYEPFNECDELLKKYHDYCVEDEIFELINRYKEDSSTWSGKDALFNAGCLAKRKLCANALFYNKDDWEVTDCPEDIENLHFCYITMHL